MADDGFFSAAEMMVVRAPLTMIPNCGHCGLFRTCHSPKMARDGQGRKGILVVAEAPGADEDAEGRPLVGRSGQRLEKELARVGIDMWADCWLDNAVICRPPSNNLAAKPTAVADCRPNILQTIKETNPRAILLLGAVAVRSVLSHLYGEEVDGVVQWQGHRIPAHDPNAWVLPTYHPSYLLRQEDDPIVLRKFRQDLERLVTLPASRPWPGGPPQFERRVEVIVDGAEAARRVARYTSGTVAFDFENTPLKPDGPDSDLVCCSVCWEGTETIAFPWVGPVRGAMVDLLRDPHVQKVAQNLQHEHRWCLEVLGVRVVNWVWDTMQASHALDSRAGVNALKFQAFVQLGQPAWNRHVEPFLKPKKKGGYTPNRVRQVGLDRLLTYCGMDSLMEYELAKVQMERMGVQWM